MAGLPTSKGVEHLNMTVADLDEATDFFVDVLGCQVLYTMGPFENRREPFIHVIANADVRSVVHHVRVLRSPFLNVELFEVTTPRQQPEWPDLMDVGGWSLSATVDDLDAAVASLADADVFALGTRCSSDGTGRRARFMTPFGLHLELREPTPDPAAAGMWSPTEPSPATPTSQPASLDPPVSPSSDAGSVPGAPGSGHPPTSALAGFRGFERLQVTVADLDEASALLEDVLGFTRCADLPSPADGDGVPFRAYANTDARARPTRARVFRSPFLNLELVECPPFPGQRTTWPAMFDVGGWHLAIYVDDVDAAYERLERTDVHLLGEKKPSYHQEAGREAYTVHCLAPFGLLFELVTYPYGRDRAEELPVPAWHPGRPSA